MTIDLQVQKTVVHNFLQIPQITFPTLKWNQAVLLLKQWCGLLLTSLKLSFKYHLLKSQKWRLIYRCKRLLFTIFCGFRKVRFHLYSPQLKWNHAVLLIKQWCGLLLTSLKLSFKYHLLKSQKWRLIYKFKRLLFTIFCGFRKVRFHCYSPQLKWNQAVLLLKQWCGLLLKSLKFPLNRICWNIRNDAWFIGAKDFCSQFFADSAKYISNATVQSWNGIKPFLYSNNDVDFF